MQVLIVEDEMLMAKQLQKLLLEVAPEANVVAITGGIAQTVGWLACNNQPDLILMDIELADGQSFDIFNHTQVKAPVIFTTAYDEFALKAFKVNSIDYLLKPVRRNELLAALNKFKQNHNNISSQNQVTKLLNEIKQLQQPKGYKTRVLVKQGQKMISIETKEVAYFFSENGYTFLRTHSSQKFLIEFTLEELQQSLAPDLFFRANRQFIISQQCVLAIHQWFNQKLKVEVAPSTEEHIIISRDRANEFKSWMGA